MGRCRYREVFVVSMVGNAYTGQMTVVLMIRRCPWWGGAHCAHEGRCPHWGHAQGACSGEVLVVLTVGKYPWWGDVLEKCPWCLQWENVHNGSTTFGAPDGEMLMMGQLLIVPMPGVFVPVVGAACSSHVRDAQQRKGWRGLMQQPLLYKI